MFISSFVYKKFKISFCFRITVRTFIENIESNDSNTVITRVKKLNKSQQQDNSLNKSDISDQQIISNKASVSPVDERKSNSSIARTTSPQQKDVIISPKLNVLLQMFQ